jgi:hypothetical protein
MEAHALLSPFAALMDAGEWRPPASRARREQSADCAPATRLPPQTRAAENDAPQRRPLAKAPVVINDIVR